MRKIVKKLELKRETVRTLVMKTGIRAGDLVDDFHPVSWKTGPDTGGSTLTGSTSNYDPTSIPSASGNSAGDNGLGTNAKVGGGGGGELSQSLHAHVLV